MANSKDKEDHFIQGRWNKISTKNKIFFTAKYDKIKDWRMDPLGYFLIGIDKKKN